jgi:hypothetical protein
MQMIKLASIPTLDCKLFLVWERMPYSLLAILLNSRSILHSFFSLLQCEHGSNGSLTTSHLIYKFMLLRQLIQWMDLETFCCLHATHDLTLGIYCGTWPSAVEVWLPRRALLRPLERAGDEDCSPYSESSVCLITGRMLHSPCCALMG